MGLQPRETITVMDDRIKALKEFCKLPVSQLADYTLDGIFERGNRWVSGLFQWLFSDNVFLNWFSELKESNPIIFWSTSVIWIPVAIVWMVTGVFFTYFSAFLGLLLTLGLSVLFVVMCKLIYLILLICE